MIIGGQHVGDGRPGRHVEGQFAQFALGRADGNLVDTFNHPGGRDIELGQFRVENGLFVFDVAAAWRPADPRAVPRRQHQGRHRVAAVGVTLDGHRLRRAQVHIQIGQDQGQLIDQPAGHGQRQAAVRVALRHRQLVLHLDLVIAALFREQLPGVWFRVGNRQQCERFLRVGQMRQHGGVQQHRQGLAPLRRPVDAGGGQRILIVYGDGLGHRLRQGGNWRGRFVR